MTVQRTSSIQLKQTQRFLFSCNICVLGNVLYLTKFLCKIGILLSISSYDFQLSARSDKSSCNLKKAIDLLCVHIKIEQTTGYNVKLQREKKNTSIFDLKWSTQLIHNIATYIIKKQFINAHYKKKFKCHLSL